MKEYNLNLCHNAFDLEKSSLPESVMIQDNHIRFTQTINEVIYISIDHCSDFSVSFTLERDVHITINQIFSKGSHLVSKCSFDLKDNSELSFIEIFENNNKNEHQLNAAIGYGACLNYFHFNFGNLSQKTTGQFSLLSPSASANIHSFYAQRNIERFQFNIEVKHLAPSTYSSQKVKGVLYGNSQSNFKGRIHINKNASQSEAFQINKNFVLSNGARAIGMPELEILTDDVKCSHGCSTGSLDKAAQFYLESRGINPIIANDLLIKAEMNDIIFAIKNPSLAQKITQTAHSFLENLCP